MIDRLFSCNTRVLSIFENSIIRICLKYHMQKSRCSRVCHRSWTYRKEDVETPCLLKKPTPPSLSAIKSSLNGSMRENQIVRLLNIMISLFQTSMPKVHPLLIKGTRIVKKLNSCNQPLLKRQQRY